MSKIWLCLNSKQPMGCEVAVSWSSYTKYKNRT